MCIVERRKSARISALQAQKAPQEKNQILNKGKRICDAAMETGVAELDSYLNQERKKVKIRPVQDLFANSVEYQVPKRGSRKHHTNAAVMPSGSAFPERSKLQLLLWILKRRDSHYIFSEPVNPEEVEHYYDVIKEPMDFGTITAKLNGGSYKSLQEFEHDVTLVWSNAMHFNQSSTIYYRQACVIRNLATKLFDSLKTDPENSVAILQAGCRGGRRSKYSEVGRRDTYWPLNTLLNENESIVSTVYLSQKDLVQNKLNSIGYAESLLQFVRDLGPAAHTVAGRKLQKSAEAAINVERVLTCDTINLPGVLSKGNAHSNFPTTREARSNMRGRSIQTMSDHGIGNTCLTNPLFENPNFSATWNLDRNVSGKSIQVAPDQDTGDSYMNALLGSESCEWDRLSDLRGESVQTMPEQDMGNSHFTNPLFGNSNFSARDTSINFSGKSVWGSLDQHSGSSFINNSSFGDGSSFPTTWKTEIEANNLFSGAFDNMSSSEPKIPAVKGYGSSSSSSAAWLSHNTPEASQSPATWSMYGSYLNNPGGEFLQYQSMADIGSTSYASYMEQAGPAESPPQSVFSRPQSTSAGPSQWRGIGTSTSNLKAIELSDIDEWFRSH
ncbi:hypothetical protein M0R45_037704 [Rubus argutus]|uniref:Bromo domain-containing protein n=1 Tax=Rubus argutus TaxID=59490 RepID=A0AAW1W566_RUBAR